MRARPRGRRARQRPGPVGGDVTEEVRRRVRWFGSLERTAVRGGVYYTRNTLNLEPREAERRATHCRRARVRVAGQLAVSRAAAGGPACRRSAGAASRGFRATRRGGAPARRCAHGRGIGAVPGAGHRRADRGGGARGKAARPGLAADQWQAAGQRAAQQGGGVNADTAAARRRAGRRVPRPQ